MFISPQNAPERLHRQIDCAACGAKVGPRGADLAAAPVEPDAILSPIWAKPNHRGAEGPRVVGVFGGGHEHLVNADALGGLHLHANKGRHHLARAPHPAAPGPIRRGQRVLAEGGWQHGLTRLLEDLAEGVVGGRPKVVEGVRRLADEGDGVELTKVFRRGRACHDKRALHSRHVLFWANGILV